MPDTLRPALCRLAAATLALALAGCGYDPEDAIEARGCLWVLDAAKYGGAFAGREVPVCGSLDLEDVDGQLHLTDSMKPQLRVHVQLPAAPNGDPGVARVLAVVARGTPSGNIHVPEARYHGRIEVRAGRHNLLHVTRVDWLDGRPPEWQ